MPHPDLPPELSGAAGPASPGPTRLGRYGRALRHRDYRLFFFGQLFSLVGTWIQTTALGWLVFRLTGSPAALGLMAAATQGPILLLTLYGGAIADRSDRRRLILRLQFVAAAIAGSLAVLTLSGVIEVWHTFVLGACLGTVNAFEIPARQSFIVQLVGREDLPNAIALNSTMFNLARITGPAIGGVLIATAGEGWCFALNTISFVFIIGALALIRADRAPVPSRASALSEMRAGFVYVWGERRLRALLLGVAIASAAGTPYLTLLPAFARQVLGADADAYGVLVSAAGLGALVGALMLAGRSSIAGLARWPVRALVVFGTALAALAWAPGYWLAVPCLLAAGGGMMVLTASINTLLQDLVDDAFRGRVISFFALALLGLAPLGAVVLGALAEATGPRWAFSAGALVLLGAAWSFRDLPARLSR